MEGLRRFVTSHTVLAGAVLVIVVAAMAWASITITSGSRHAKVLSNGSPPGGTAYGGIIVHPGEPADFTVTVENTGSAPVVLEHAALIPLPGFPAPKLVHIGVLAEHFNLLGAVRGWPILKGGSPSSGYWAVLPLHNYDVMPWSTRRSRHMGPLPDMIVYSVLGTQASKDYVSAGLEVTYRLGSAIYTQALYSGGDDCVLAVALDKRAIRQALYNRYCASVDNKAIKSLTRLASQVP